MFVIIGPLLGLIYIVVADPKDLFGAFCKHAASDIGLSVRLGPDNTQKLKAKLRNFSSQL